MRPPWYSVPIEGLPDIRGKLVRGELATRRFLARRSFRPQISSAVFPNYWSHRPLTEMQYRGKEYSVVQGIKPGTWTVRLDENNVRTGVDKTRSAAMESVGRLVDRALSPKTVKLTRPAD